MAKTAYFGVMHLGIAFGVGFALTGSMAVAGAITVVEPLCNMVAHYFFDRWWDERHRPALAPGHAQRDAAPGDQGAVSASSRASQRSACSRLLPHISAEA